MTHQLDLFAATPLAPGQMSEFDRKRQADAQEAERRRKEGMAKARASDPASSHEAAQRMNESGAARAQAERIADLVFQAGQGITAYELEHQMAKDEHPLTQVQILRRLSSIAGVRRGTEAEMRVCRVSRRKTLTWWPSDDV